jgi:hypothetical protein
VTVLVALTLLALVRIAWRWLTRRQKAAAYMWQSALAIAASSAMLTVGFMQFNLTVAFQAQGRYLFPMILPAALMFTGGLYMLTTLIRNRFLSAVVLAIPLIWLAVCNFIGLLIVNMTQ